MLLAVLLCTNSKASKEFGVVDALDKAPEVHCLVIAETVNASVGAKVGSWSWVTGPWGIAGAVTAGVASGLYAYDMCMKDVKRRVREREEEKRSKR